MIIGISGTKRSGKDTVAQYIQLFCPQFKIYHFADPVKEACSRILHLSLSEIEMIKNDTLVWNDMQLSGRHVVREIGMLMTEIDPNILIDYANQKIFECAHIIFSDVRRIHEFEFIRQRGGIMLFVSNNNLDTDEDTHITETFPFKEACDYFILNNSDKETLFTQIENFVKDFIHEKIC